MLLISRCAGGCGHLSEQADQGGSGAEPVCELPSAPTTAAGLQNPALPTQVRAKRGHAVHHYHYLDVVSHCVLENKWFGLHSEKKILIKNRTENWLCF